MRALEFLDKKVPVWLFAIVLCVLVGGTGLAATSVFNGSLHAHSTDYVQDDQIAANSVICTNGSHQESAGCGNAIPTFNSLNLSSLAIGCATIGGSGAVQSLGTSCTQAGLSTALIQGQDGADHLYVLADPSGSGSYLDSGNDATLQPLGTDSTTLCGGPALASSVPCSAQFTNQNVKWASATTYTPNTSHFTAEVIFQPTTNPYGSGSCEVILGNAALGNTLSHCSDSITSYLGFGINFGDHVNGCHVSNGTTYAIAAAPTFASGTTYLLDCVFTGTAVNLYVNGAFYSTAPFSGSYSNGGQTFTLGGDSLSGNMNFTGYLNDVAMYNTALTAAQIAAHNAALNVGGSTQFISNLITNTLVTQKLTMPNVASGHCPQATTGGAIVDSGAACGMSANLPTCSSAFAVCRINVSCSVSTTTSCTTTFSTSNTLSVICSAAFDSRNSTVPTSSFNSIAINATNGTETVTLTLLTAQSGQINANVICG